MNSLVKPFDFKGTPVRAVVDDVGDPWFVAKDVCDVLDIRTDTVRGLLDPDEVSTVNPNSIGVAQNGGREPLIVSEPGLYGLILKSRKPNALEFKRWIKHEVLPSIRRHGAYMTDEVIERTLTDPDYLIRLATQLKEQKAVIEEQKATLTEQAPKVLFADAITVSEDCVLVGQLAKVLKQNGVEIGQNRLYQWLRDNHYLSSRRGDDWNTPTQKAVDMGLFRTKSRVFIDSVGNEFVSLPTVVTGKGQEYFVGKFLGDRQEQAA